ncbi:hypothetical protein AAFJ72_02075 [Brevibacillus gelatini]|uniref:hypothetical protein n=1 Tax=Brevibacillus gelatini TaxID=1655277 RepID=UPI003D812706
MKKTQAVILATSLLGLGLTGFYAVKSHAEETPKMEATQSATIAEPVTAEQQTELVPAVMDAKTLQAKMLNAIDNYQNVSGSYRVILAPLGVDETVEFEVQQGNNPRSHVKVLNNTKAELIKETAFDGEFYWDVKHNRKTYKKTKVSKANEPTAFNKNEPRTYKNEQGEKVFVKRPDPAFSASAKDVVFPQDYAFWLTPDNHEIVGTEKLLNRTVAMVKGKHEDRILAEKHQATHFTMWVDTETGVLLKLEETNDKNEVTNSIEVLSIEFDKEAKKATFALPESFQNSTPSFEQTKFKQTTESAK